MVCIEYLSLSADLQSFYLSSSSVWPFCQCCTRTPLPSGSAFWEFLAPLAPALLNVPQSPFLFSCCVMLIFVCMDSECISCCTVGTRSITRNKCARDFGLRSVALHMGVTEKVDAWSQIQQGNSQVWWDNHIISVYGKAKGRVARKRATWATLIWKNYKTYKLKINKCLFPKRMLID